MLKLKEFSEEEMINENMRAKLKPVSDIIKINKMVLIKLLILVMISNKNAVQVVHEQVICSKTATSES